MKQRSIWALYNRYTGEFIRAIADKPDKVTRAIMNHIEYVRMAEVLRYKPKKARKA